MRRTVARDSVAYPVGKTLQKTVIPIRVSVIALAMPKIMERADIPALMGYLSLARAGLLGASIALLALILLTQGKRRFLFGGAGLLAADVLLIALTALIALAKLPRVMAELSDILALQLGLLQRALLPAVLLTEGALLLTGVLMLARYGAGQRRSRRERKSA